MHRLRTGHGALNTDTTQYTYYAAKVKSWCDVAATIHVSYPHKTDESQMHMTSKLNQFWCERMHSARILAQVPLMTISFITTYLLNVLAVPALGSRQSVYKTHTAIVCVCMRVPKTKDQRNDRQKSQLYHFLVRMFSLRAILSRLHKFLVPRLHQAHAHTRLTLRKT